MDNYDVHSVTGVVNYKLRDKPEGNFGGPWDPATFDVEDSAFGFVRFTTGASLQVEASWALNITDSRESCTTLCGTEGGSETIQKGRDYICTLNHIVGGEPVLTRNESGSAYLGPAGEAMDPMAAMGAMECEQWLDAIVNDTEPLVTAEQAVVVTEIIDAIYTSARTGKEVVFAKK